MGNDRIQRKLSKGKEQELNERDVTIIEIAF
jgi:hypothetical protein